jgi:hypothetical protein
MNEEAKKSSMRFYDERTNNDIKNTTQCTKDRAIQIPLKTVGVTTGYPKKLT